MDFRILGPLEVVDEGRAITLGGSRQQALLALLLLHVNETLTTDRLIDELWGDNPPGNAVKTVQVQISRLRKALAGDGSPGPVVTRGRGYELKLDPDRLDAHCFESLVAEGRSELGAGHPERAAAVLEEALSLWRGAALGELAYESFAQREIARLEDLRIEALEHLVEAKLALGRHSEVIGQLEALIAEHPYRERLRSQLMIALYRSDRQADALQAYQQARAALVEQLGIEPGERLRELERAVLAQDPALHLRVAPEPPVAERGVETLEISLFGPPRVSRSGRPVSLESRKAIALLAHLALVERPCSRAALCELLWSGQDRGHARGALSRTVTVVRTAIGDEWVDSGADSVSLRRGDELEVDVHRFRALTSEEATEEDLIQAVELFSGEPLEGFSVRDSPPFDAWRAGEADELGRELGASLGRLVGLLTERGDYGRALVHARRWLGLDRLHEPAHRALIRLYALAGDRAAALAQYRDCVRTLSSELGVAPLDETVVLFEQVSEGTLLAPSAEPSPAPPAAEARPADAPTELPLVGRSDELAALHDAHGAAAVDGRVALIEGEAGIGKTRLARELISGVSDRGGLVLAASCHEDEMGVPYGPVVELLAQALRGAGRTLAEAVPAGRLADASLLLPELGSPELPPPVAAANPAARARLLDGVAAVLGTAGQRARPGLIFVDDVHAADEATVDVLAYLGRRLKDRPLLLVLSWRSEAVPPGHRLRRLAAELSRAGAAVAMKLERFGESDVAQLSRAVRLERGPELEHRIYVESEGLPLVVAELLAAAQAGGEPLERPLTGEMQDVLEARLSGLGAVAHQLLQAAAVVGRTFGFETVRVASGRSDDEAADGLDELVARGLVREQAGPDPAYDFAHGKLRALAYERTSLARRRLLHRRVADAFMRTTPSPEGAGLVAHHLRLAGDHTAAAEQHRRAAEHAAAVLAHRDALEHLEAAVALGSPDVVELHERIADLRTLVGDYAGAVSGYERAAAECAPDALARIEHKLGGVHHRRGEWRRAEVRYAVALEAKPDAGLRARILADLSLTLHHAQEPDRATALAGEARALAESAADEQARAQAHNLLGVLARGAGRLDAARNELERSRALAERMDDPVARVAALNNLALVARDAGQVGRALELTEEALALCVAQGDRHRQAALENNLADLHHVAGRTEESMTHLKRAVAIFAEIGADEATRLPEVWKLVSW
jgi:DNA-binding SARP family transcriptional activator